MVWVRHRIPLRETAENAKVFERAAPYEGGSGVSRKGDCGLSGQGYGETAQGGSLCVAHTLAKPVWGWLAASNTPAARRR